MQLSWKQDVILLTYEVSKYLALKLVENLCNHGNSSYRHTYHCRLLFTATHEQNFSQIKYDLWLKNRKVRGSGVPFSEIDVLLCNKPTPDEIIATLPTLPRESKCLFLATMFYSQVRYLF